GQHRVEGPGADVLEVGVDAAARHRGEFALQVGGTVIHAGVETQFLHHPRHLSGPPAMPTTRAPIFLASWPAMPPTMPAAEEIVRVSPARRASTRLMPTQAVSPEVPRILRWTLSETPGMGVMASRPSAA